MSATIISEPMMVSSTTQDTSSTTTSAAAAAAVAAAGQVEIQFVTCECCGLTEECTPPYIERIRERYMGKWVCGLCAEAVKDEVVRSERLITTEEALNRHFNVCRMFRSSPYAATPPPSSSPPSATSSAAAGSGLARPAPPGTRRTENARSLPGRRVASLNFKGE